MTGQDVKDLQTYLNTHSYNCGTIDGVYGRKTKTTVILFQLANQLKGDGVVGPITRSKLK
jgi:peptidoglycan hydrolase-like protein with peptidoglycan-binding domain